MTFDLTQKPKNSSLSENVHRQKLAEEPSVCTKQHQTEKQHAYNNSTLPSYEGITIGWVNKI